MNLKRARVFDWIKELLDRQNTIGDRLIYKKKLNKLEKLASIRFELLLESFYKLQNKTLLKYLYLFQNLLL